MDNVALNNEIAEAIEVIARLDGPDAATMVAALREAATVDLAAYLAEHAGPGVLAHDVAVTRAITSMNSLTS